MFKDEELKAALDTVRASVKIDGQMTNSQQTELVLAGVVVVGSFIAAFREMAAAQTRMATAIENFHLERIGDVVYAGQRPDWKDLGGHLNEAESDR